MNTTPRINFFLVTLVMPAREQVMYFTAKTKKEAESFVASTANKYIHHFITEFDNSNPSDIPRDIAVTSGWHQKFEINKTENNT